MRNSELWRPDKLLCVDGEWQSNPAFVGRRSQHVGKLECAAYVPILEAHVSGDVVDIGAGTVPYYGLYREKANSVICTDWPNSLHDQSHIDVMLDANKQLPFADQTFDTVVLGDVLEHISEPKVLISESSRILRPGGKLLVFVPFMYWLHEEPHDYFRYTKHGLSSLAESSGLEVTSLEEYGGGGDIFIDMYQKMTANRPLLYKAGKIALSIVEATGYLERSRVKHSPRFPIGYTMVAQKSDQQLS